MNILITGGAGFIGSHLAEELLKEDTVVCVDDLSLGKRENIAHLLDCKNFYFYEQDVNNEAGLCDILKNHDINFVYHLAANSDIQKSAKDPKIDHVKTFATTASVLECMRICGVKNLFFASTSAVYGEKTNVKLDEKTGELNPISYYGAGKLASEAFISAYAYMNDLNALVFRFPNVIGPNLTHGVIFDFINKLKVNSKELQILGDGTQCKPYIHVFDLLNGIIMFSRNMEPGVRLYNIGVDTATTVTKIADIVCYKLGYNDVVYKYTGGNRGWKGDVPTFQYNMDKIYKEGWKAHYSSDEAVGSTVDSILNNL